MAKNNTRKPAAVKSAAPKVRTTQEVAARNVAKSIFDSRKDMDEVHIVSDGTAFYTLCDAKNYARTLKNDKIVTVRRSENDLLLDDTASDAAPTPQATGTDPVPASSDDNEDEDDGATATDNDEEE